MWKWTCPSPLMLRYLLAPRSRSFLSRLHYKPLPLSRRTCLPLDHKIRTQYKLQCALASERWFNIFLLHHIQCSRHE